MFTNFFPDPERNEFVVELMESKNGGSFGFIVLNQDTGRVEIQLANDGKIVKFELAEFERGIKEAKRMLQLKE